MIYDPWYNKTDQSCGITEEETSAYIKIMQEILFVVAQPIIGATKIV
jgi:hypothetical protein